MCICRLSARYGLRSHKVPARLVVCVWRVESTPPNLSREVRAIPNIEIYAPWFHCPMPRFMPRHVYAALSARGQRLCRYIVSDEALRAGYDVAGAPRL